MRVLAVNDVFRWVLKHPLGQGLRAADAAPPVPAYASCLYEVWNDEAKKYFDQDLRDLRERIRLSLLSLGHLCWMVWTNKDRWMVIADFIGVESTNRVIWSIKDDVCESLHSTKS